MRSKRLAEIVASEPLITGFEVGTELEESAGNYLGLGISNRNGLTEHLPFDTLGIVLASELVKRELGLPHAALLIADEHAKANGIDEASIDRAAKSRKDFMEMLLDRLGFAGWEVVLGSELASEPLYKEIFSSTMHTSRYERLQAADMEFFRRCGKGIKIGWRHDGMLMDERHFDRLYKLMFGDATTFVYTEAGKALDGTPLPPYLHSGNPRLLLRENEDIDHAVDGMARRVRAYCSRIADLYAKLVYGAVGDPQNTPNKLKRRLREVYSDIF